MRFITCLAAMLSLQFYFMSFFLILGIFDVIFNGSSSSNIGFDFWTMVIYPILIGGFLFKKVQDGPIIKPMFILSMIMFYGTLFAAVIVNKGFVTGNLMLKLIVIVVSLLVIVGTRAFISIYFSRNPIQS
jgi:hypothetical protein